MKHYCFVLESGEILDVIALSFSMACNAFDNSGLDPKKILEIREK